MIKGCNKRVIVMKDTGHDMIEEAFFILRPEAVKQKGSLSDGDIVKQANLILDSKGFDAPFSGIKLNVDTKKEPRSRLTPFLWGFVAGITSACILIALSL